MKTATAAKPKGIIFTGKSVRAIMARAKFQTRRVVKPQPEGPGPSHWYYDADGDWWTCGNNSGRTWRCPYGRVGDLLYGKETWMPVDLSFRVPPNVVYKKDYSGKTHAIVYRADAEYHADWNNALFMPKWAARLWLEIVSVRVERVQSISDTDVWAEGFHECDDGDEAMTPDGRVFKPKAAFATVWQSIHCKGAGTYCWEVNPWVWAISFKVVAPSAPSGGRGSQPAPVAEAGGK